MLSRLALSSWNGAPLLPWPLKCVPPRHTAPHHATPHHSSSRTNPLSFARHWYYFKRELPLPEEVILNVYCKLYSCCNPYKPTKTLVFSKQSHRSPPPLLSFSAWSRYYTWVSHMLGKCFVTNLHPKLFFPLILRQITGAYQQALLFVFAGFLTLYPGLASSASQALLLQTRTTAAWLGSK